MILRLLKFLLSLLALVAIVTGLDSRLGQVPPLGKFLDPFHGFWRNAEMSDALFAGAVALPGLKHSVTVIFDDRRVPHIFAENAHDLYFVQGYVTARERLWQMEFQTHAAAGRLSEIVGAAALEYDKFQRRIGMTYGAEQALQAMQEDSAMFAVVQAYTEGINDYIAGLQPEDYPTEYKILDYAPEKWTSLKCAFLLKYMCWMLTGNSRDLQMSNVLAKFGADTVNDLFPELPDKVEPVIPAGTRWRFQPVKPARPDGSFVPSVTRDLLPFQPDQENGSNNWAVAGSKTANGYPLLANDPHLGLNLPAIWYEIHLIGPGVNSYGVSLPGAPNIIIGFNESVAWGVTNSEADVLDWYEIEFRDQTRQEYRYAEGWQPVQERIETILVRGGDAVRDTVLYTHHGPVVLKQGEAAFGPQAPAEHAMKWIGHIPSNEVRTFYDLNRARNYDDYVAALRSYVSPAQNFVFAGREGEIAIWHNGRFPARWQEQGKYILDGRDPRHDWQSWIPQEHNPHIKNPSSGFVASANQNATDSTYPYYLAGNFAPYYRSARIHEWLRNSDNLEPEDFGVIQLDTKNLHAESILPELLQRLPANADAQHEAVIEILSTWDFFNDAAKIAPTVFKKWWGLIYHAIWDDEFGDANFRLPHRARTVQMILQKPDAAWFDDSRTANIETVDDLILSTFNQTVAELQASLGPPGENWRWGRYKRTDLLHLARMPGLGRMNLHLGGDFGIVNATATNHGPSWRMVVSLGPEVVAWGIYPGGQSGNPGSRRYDDFVDTWADGELVELFFPRSPHEDSSRVAHETHFDPR